MAKACVVSCAGLRVEPETRRAFIDGTPIAEGDWISIDGGTDEVFLGQRDVVTERPQAALDEVAKWRAEVHSIPPKRQTG